MESFDDVLLTAARSLLISEGRDPEELVSGAYNPTDDPDGKLCCDEIQMIGGQAIGLIHAYRREAARYVRFWMSCCRLAVKGLT